MPLYAPPIHDSPPLAGEVFSWGGKITAVGERKERARAATLEAAGALPATVAVIISVS